MLNSGFQLSWSFSPLDGIAFGWLPFRLKSLSSQWWTSTQGSCHSLLWCEYGELVLISTIASLATKVYIFAKIKFEKKLLNLKIYVYAYLCICLYSATSSKNESTYNSFVDKQMSVLALTYYWIILQILVNILCCILAIYICFKVFAEKYLLIFFPL